MIDGLKLTITGEEPRALLERRINGHLWSAETARELTSARYALAARPGVVEG